MVEPGLKARRCDLSIDVTSYHSLAMGKRAHSYEAMSYEIDMSKGRILHLKSYRDPLAIVIHKTYICLDIEVLINRAHFVYKRVIPAE